MITAMEDFRLQGEEHKIVAFTDRHIALLNLVHVRMQGATRQLEELKDTIQLLHLLDTNIKQFQTFVEAMKETKKDSNQYPTLMARNTSLEHEIEQGIANAERQLESASFLQTRSPTPNIKRWSYLVQQANN